MLYDILVTKIRNNQYTARVMNLPEIIVSGKNDRKVVEKARAEIAKVQANSTIIRVEVPALASESNDPWLRFAGIWEHDPDWEMFQTEIKHFRDSIDHQTGMENSS
ncbi:MAG: hypothetical protein HUU38_28520 [Anaerolineales bacterium]|nr:hypothetical protein [Anaerolineales bacterium]